MNAHPAQYLNSLAESEPDEADLRPLPLGRYRSVFISDFHLGTKGSKAHLLLDFIRATDADYLYLVGDIFDGWQLKKNWFWPQAHSDVIQKLLRKARKGTKVFYIPGNHDEFARQYLGNNVGGIEVLNELVHTTADGKRLLVLHGDQFDGVVKFNRWAAVLGSHAYEFSMWLNHYYNKIRRAMGLPYWSLSNYLKQRVKNAVAYIGEFEKAVAQEARQRHCDGILCGHIHKAEMRTIEGVQYLNSGDWVESCTAIVEHADGRLELVNWLDQPAYRDEYMATAILPPKGKASAPELATAGR
jgi:UDP-2,3-diacylglucosamine pyrophosphatase LpxH